MNLASKLGIECDCGEELIWWYEEETETTMEVYVDCNACGAWFPKEFVDRSGDTSYDALKDVALKIAK